ncbi:hypothetical protein [Catenuloplanes indicus]|uniref:PPE family domain-containing protein n=1 Tax=Catenuloplanes indicus TaxID=137267 RepID=A0AAE3W357_9ACTN|nr:hypothetical protein [Catenuloplanes indicus]MDQ0368501.1 hypothetical protein [Catenuloplanes indicus]
MAIDNGHADWTGTPWHTRDIPSMWATVAHHTPDAYATHLAGWRRTTELLSTHVARMRTYRDNLAIAWPPTRSPAAAVYLSRFDTDIANAQATLNASIANYTAYAAAMHILSDAQTALRPLADEYAANTAAESSRQQMASASNSRAAATTFLATQDTEKRQAELTRIARSIMYRASQELIEATAALQIAPPYHETGSYFAPRDIGVSPPSIPEISPLNIPPSSGASATPPGISREIILSTDASKTSLAGVAGPIDDLGRATEPSISEGHKSNTKASWPALASPQIIGAPPSAGQNSTNSTPRRSAATPDAIIGIPPSSQPVSQAQTIRTSSVEPSPGTAATNPVAFNNGAVQRGQATDKNLPLDLDTLWSTDEGVAPVVDIDQTSSPITAGPAIGIDR